MKQFFVTCRGIRKYMPTILHYLFHLAWHLINIKHLQTLEDKQLTSRQHIWVGPGVFQCPMLWRQLQPAEFLTNVFGGNFPAVMKWGEMNALTGWVSSWNNIQGVSKRALQLWKLIEIYTEDIHNVLNCQNVAKYTELTFVDFEWSSP